MQIEGFVLNITSANPQRLLAFYRDAVGIPLDAEHMATYGDEALKFGAATVFIDGHSDTAEQSKDPTRFLLDITVSDIESEVRRLKELGVRFLREPEQEPWGAIIATFVDPDGNYAQLFEAPKPGSS